jgi:hypothetical protein
LPAMLERKKAVEGNKIQVKQISGTNGEKYFPLIPDFFIDVAENEKDDDKKEEREDQAVF